MTTAVTLNTLEYNCYTPSHDQHIITSDSSPPPAPRPAPPPPAPRHTMINYNLTPSTRKYFKLLEKNHTFCVRVVPAGLASGGTKEERADLRPNYKNTWILDVEWSTTCRRPLNRATGSAAGQMNSPASHMPVEL